MTITCSADSCTSAARTRGMCRNHYMQAHRRGLEPLGPNDRRLRRRVLDDLLELKVDRRDSDGCWPWLGYVRPNGYGIQHIDGIPRQAHRVVYELLVGPIPTDMTLDHLCHDGRLCRLGGACPHRRCVNPSHMAVVSRGENCRRASTERWAK